MKEAVVGRRKGESKKSNVAGFKYPGGRAPEEGRQTGAVVLSQSRPRITDNVMQRVLDAGEVARKVL